MPHDCDRSGTRRELAIYRKPQLDQLQQFIVDTCLVFAVCKHASILSLCGTAEKVKTYLTGVLTVISYTPRLSLSNTWPLYGNHCNKSG